MNIIVCIKAVPDDQDIAVNADRTLNFDRARPTISTYDLNALEAAVRIAEAAEPGSVTVTALSVGGPEVDNSKLKKDILSRGADRLVMVADEATGALDTHQTALALKAAVEAAGGADLVICGEGSADLYAQQAGIQLGELMGLPVVNGIGGIEMGEGVLEVQRMLEDQVQTLEVGLPAVICVTSDINLPRIASMKQILAAGKKPSEVHSAADVGFGAPATIETASTLAPEEADRAREICDGSTEDGIARFAEKLAESIR